ncbi:MULTISPECIES: sensor histidine kinase [Bacillota]|uniref:histidine kinase n=2 Tax=Bacillota TaxID=1239 RepID=A0AAN1D5W1_PARTM|nr:MULTISPECIES: HAMP domain-containing sensor histidine kinase [Bacillota]ALF09481.1 histidine kinase [Parageobacillus thermoglucosidasius]ANZ29564.1 two-component sensor histidine kinase [Parageobacillus thermoglucosidasius]APM80302.1 two-component sensor histidine kinase [Parageobacillus thermoglucosidasius]KJX70157.1 histidine kinase [Parageobacillus thermoglucosidasius]MBY6278022.1 sensor histidine kinase [Symbiobacterium thermophilum]
MKIRSKKLSIKKWLFILLFCVSFIPIFLTFIISKSLVEDPKVPINNNYLNVRDEILNNVSKWSEPEWQKEIKPKLDRYGIQVRLFNSANKELFSNFSYSDMNEQPSNTNIKTRPVEEHLVFKGSKIAGIAYIHVTQSSIITVHNSKLKEWFNEYGGLVIWLTFSLIMLIFCTWFINKALLHPLKKLAEATKSISMGMLNIDLPKSPIQEIERVSTAFRIMSQKLDDSIKQQVKMEEERKLFISSIIHDLRTPLFSIRGYLEGIQKGIADTPEKIAKYIEVCQRKANVLDTLISDLFIFTKLEHLEQEPNFEKINIYKFLNNIIKEFKLEAEKKKIKVEIVSSVTNHVIFADEHLLTRAIDNLLNNALRHTPNDGKITISLNETDEHIEISVIDTGEGINPKDLPYLFTPLYRGEGSRNRKTGGAGLGLTIAKKIFLAHGGDLRAGNHISHGGAVFTAFLPKENSK